MFNKNSIFFTLGAGFTIAVIILIFSYFTIIQKENRQDMYSMKKRYLTVIKVIDKEYYRAGFTQSLDDILNDMGFDIVYGENITDILKKQDLKLLFKNRFHRLNIIVLKGDKDNYIHIQAPFDDYLLIDNKNYTTNTTWITTAVFLSILIVFILISYTVYRKLYPLNELTKQIDRIDNGDMEFKNISLNGKDEVSLLANELLAKSGKLKVLQDARNVFIRNIMHELKTPITKGKILCELDDDEQNREKLKHIFVQMESLINEFASIEQIISTDIKLDKKLYHFDDILEEALDKLMFEVEDYKYYGSDLKINVNFKLFSTAIKNLIDNGYKYSDNKKVDIVTSEDKIEIINKGKMLKYPLEKYYTPFFNRENKSSDSFGLGLYIIHNILEAHGFKLKYSYNDGKNFFTVIF